MCLKKLTLLVLIGVITMPGALSQTMTFKAVTTTSDMLDQIIAVTATSKIECAALCAGTMNYHSCAAYHFDVLTAICSCGSLREIGLAVIGNDATIYVNILCKWKESRGVKTKSLIMETDSGFKEETQEK